MVHASISISQRMELGRLGESAMPDTINRGELEALKKKLADVADHSPRMLPQLSDAIGGMLTAVSYADEVLLKSSVNSVLSSLTDVARDIIEKEVKAAKDTRDGIKKAWREYVDGVPCEDFDELKNVIESLIDERI